jgi:hypothetical protein
VRDLDESDREADEYELRLHRRSASRGLLLGGLLTASKRVSGVLQQGADVYGRRRWRMVPPEPTA